MPTRGKADIAQTCGNAPAYDPTRTLASDGFNLRLEMFVFFRFLLVARARTLMCVLAASHRWAHCALVSAPALRHNRRQALATASLHWQSSPSQARCPSGERVRLQ